MKAVVTLCFAQALVGLVLALPVHNSSATSALANQQSAGLVKRHLGSSHHYLQSLHRRDEDEGGDEEEGDGGDQQYLQRRGGDE
ncbi:hypothetical protein H4R35_002950, partial [Dimargaris xerosporica]